MYHPSFSDLTRPVRPAGAQSVDPLVDLGRVSVLIRLSGLFLVAIGAALFTQRSADAADDKPETGLTVTVTSDSRAITDVTTTPNVRLYVEAGMPPTPFLPGGKFTAVWQGAIHADLRGNFAFQATLNGKLKIEINRSTALEAAGTGETTPLGKMAPLNKGPNAFKATFTSPDRGDAFVRLDWTEKGPFTSPIPPDAFTYSVTPELLKAGQLRLGRELFLERRCVRCHADANLAEASVPELRMDAPSLEGIGVRRHSHWMARWIREPKSLRPTANMPKLLHGPQAQEDAEAIAAYLATLQTGGPVKPAEARYQTKQKGVPEDEAAPAVGEPKPLYERLHCTGCHDPPGAPELDPIKLSQQGIAEKFPAGKLAEFLRAPEAGYAWTRMPNFHLSEQEATELERWLFAAAPKPTASAALAGAVILEKGRKLVQRSGCLNCHALKLENQSIAPRLADLGAGRWDQGCLAAKAGPEAKAPQFSFTAAEREALAAFGRSDRASLARRVPAEFAERQERLLNCTACHGQVDFVPPLEVLGGRLKPEWAAKFMAGDIPHKIRYDFHPRGEPWLEARMPAFRSRAELLALGMAEQHGYPPKSPVEPPVNTTLGEIGRKLVGKDGGFSCVSCHAVGPLLAMEVFESEGVNLALSADRLLPDYYRRWVRAPTSIDPQTKMPVYFEEGKSPLTDILDGDGEKQITAIWEYLRLRDKMPAPNTGAQ